MKNFTSFSQDTPNPKKVNIHKLLNCNEDIEAKHVPSNKSVSNILSFSKAFEAQKSRSLGFLETILN